MNNLTLAQIAYMAATKCKTMYVTGGQGQPLKDTAVKKMFIERYPQNEQLRKDKILNAPADCFAFDCNGLIKAIINGWIADTSDYRGGSVYDSVIPDITCEAMINGCSGISTDFRSLDIGELLYLPGHVGVVVSISPALAAEATPLWDGDVQLTAVNREISGYHRRDWQRHGKMTKYVTYNTTDYCQPDVQKISNGIESPWVLTAQRLLMAAGCNPGPLDGKCGPKTVAAIRAFQQDHRDLYGNKLEVDGKIYALTWGALLKG